MEQPPEVPTEPVRDAAAHLRVGDAERHEVAEHLRQAAGEGRLDLDELEQRLEACFAARTYGELTELVVDLPPLGASLPAVLPPAVPAPAGTADAWPSTEVRQRSGSLVMFSGLERRGTWTPALRTTVVAVWGGAEIDLREARWPSDRLEISAHAVMGGVHVVVGPEVDVVMEGMGVMGAHAGPRSGPVDVPGRPRRTLRVSGFALWGAVQVERKPLRAEPGPGQRRPR
ncbi:DUF1707 domain-containing protein [Nocardioides sp. GY 10127]|uniref:DUF1707 SHOCT-like domain-containing protein n=1 Tax=Nocardioides sp. GY 10127 TaxID=2569762 RepID=UPI0010A8D6C4|nr:DUF1707 domain-containing protein [Nocardioides sp. GY 10127]TIC81731.1 DUF1707 domain-containing protein [Nocardioides sp. GY 10127]